MCLQAAQFLHGLNPLVEGSEEDTLMLDLTTISLMFMGLQKATMGGLGMAFAAFGRAKNRKVLLDGR